MEDIRGLVVNLIGSSDLSSMTAEDIGGNISLNLYELRNSVIKEMDIFNNLPDIIKDTILIIDFDTELSMNGILGFLENSTGLFLTDTIKTLEKIEAYKDSEILENIQKIMLTYGINTKQLRDNVNAGNHYDITNFSKTHGDTDMADKISEEAEGLYLYQDERNIFTNLLKYIDINKSTLIEYLNKQ
jgi:hypothetical protein